MRWPSSVRRARARPRTAATLAVACFVAAFVALACAGTEPAAPMASPSSVETSAPTPLPSPLPTPPPVPDVTLAAVGDLMLARRVETLMLERGLTYPFERIQPLFQGADIVVGNMEGAFTDRGTPLVKQYTFRTAPLLATALGAAGFHAVSLANNHTTDFGATSLEDTRASLDQARVRTFGAGASLAAAEAPAVLRTAAGARVAFVGFDDIGEVLFATATEPGVARADPLAIARAVAAARAEADYVVLFAHWGTEYSPAPTDRQRQLARAAIEAGADLVLGAHPHVLQPIERLERGVVLYSLGNFVFDLDVDDMTTLGEGPFQSVVARITLSKSAPPRLELQPVRIDPTENRPRPATAEEAASILAQLGELAMAPR